MKNTLFSLFSGLIIITLFLALSYGIFSGLLSDSVPDEETIENCNITTPASLLLDSAGVCYINAGSDLDAAFTLGFAHARDRMFQMELTRRIATGRLSELFGSVAVDIDKLFKSLNLRAYVQQTLSNMPQERLKFLTAYADGVNHYISTHKNRLPVEFDALGFTPEPWTPAHTLLTGKMLAWELHNSWENDILLQRVASLIGEDLTYSLFTESGNTTTSAKNTKKSNPDVSLLLKGFSAYTSLFGTAAGNACSNAWALLPRLTSGNATMIANDPHLGTSFPSRFYVAVINSPQWTVSGFTIPGIPVVLVGKNNNIAWTLTSLMSDGMDFYYESLSLADSTYLVKGEKRKLTLRSDTIRVKNGEDIIHATVYTHRGPVISDLHPGITHPANSNKTPKISVRWQAFSAHDDFSAFLNLNRASSLREAKSACNGLSAPGLHIIAADKNNISSFCAASLPAFTSKRKPFIFDGTTGSGEWSEMASVDDLPASVNPESGYIISANTRPVGESQFFISQYYAPDSRAVRLQQLLSQNQRFSVDDVSSMQHDQTSPFVLKTLPTILSAFEHIRVKDPNLKQSLNLLRNWDGKSDAYLVAPTLYWSFIRCYLRNTLQDDLGTDLYDRISQLPYLMINAAGRMLLSENLSVFYNRTKRKTESNETLIRRSLADALTELEKSLGTDMKKWLWGESHILHLQHPFNSPTTAFAGKVLDAPFFGVGGDITTINKYGFSLGTVQEGSQLFRVDQASAFRFIADFSQPGYIFVQLPGGNSGNPLSPYYANLLGEYIGGVYRKIPLDPANAQIISRTELVK